MKIKKGVDVFGAQNELLLALMVADGIWQELGQELWVTSILDSKHSRTSLHYVGFAGDLRTRYFDDNGERAAEMLRNALPDDYDVVVEGNHIHLEFQPKRG